MQFSRTCQEKAQFCHPSFTLIIDEFQNFLKINPAVFSDIQRDWDLHKRTSYLNLIISGSVFTLMTKIFEDGTV